MGSERFRYKAFVSYSHRDQAVAQWLHRALESYRTPAYLVGRETATGLVEKRLGTIFRDRDELPVAADLTGQINEALAATQFLIVLCSPASAQSKWVNQEVINFKRLKGAGSIIAVIVEGEPYASTKPGQEALECFAPGLRYHVTADGTLTDQPAEPIAADLRPGKDGKRMVKLKVIAGLLGVGLDELVQRETQRRQRFMTAVTFASLLGIGVMGALTFNAIAARTDAEIAQEKAERRRTEAEELLEFMLTDLKRPLMEVGRLSEYNKVAERALNYYQRERLEDLPDGSLGRRARALHLLGEARLQEGKNEAALEIFQETYAATQELYERARNDTARIYEHSQSAFWLGRTFLEIGQVPQAAEKMGEMLQLAQAVNQITPNDANNMASVARAHISYAGLLVRLNRSGEALKSFEKARSIWEQVLTILPGDDGITGEIAHTFGWLGDTNESLGKLKSALDYHARGMEMFSTLRNKYVQERDFENRLMIAKRKTAGIAFQLGDINRALVLAQDALKLADGLISNDPSNARLRREQARLLTNLARYQVASGQWAIARSTLDHEALRNIKKARAADKSQTWHQEILILLAYLEAKILYEQGRRDEALSLLRGYVDAAMQQASSSGDAATRLATIRVLSLAGDLTVRADAELARTRWEKARSIISELGELGGPEAMTVRAAVDAKLGLQKEADEAQQYLNAARQDS